MEHLGERPRNAYIVAAANVGIFGCIGSVGGILRMASGSGIATTGLEKGPVGINGT